MIELYRLRAIAEALGMERHAAARLFSQARKRRGPGRWLCVSRGDLEKYLPSGADLEEIARASLVGENGQVESHQEQAGSVAAAPVPRLVQVVRRPINTKLCICRDERGQVYHVIVKHNQCYPIGLQLYALPHTVKLGWWRVAGPEPLQPNDRSYGLKLSAYKKKVET